MTIQESWNSHHSWLAELKEKERKHNEEMKDLQKKSKWCSRCGRYNPPYRTIQSSMVNESYYYCGQCSGGN